MIFTVFLVFTFALALVLSFYFSGTEAGFLGLSREKLHADIKQQRRGADALRPFAEHVPLFLAVVLFGNTFANVTATFLANKLWQKFLGESYLTLFVLLSTGCFLLVGEIFPKIFFRRYSPGLLYATSRVLLFFRRLLHPFVSAVLWLERLGSGAAGRLQTDGEQPAGQPDVSRADLQELMSAGLEEGVFSEQELAFINNLSSFSRITAEEVMKPLVKLFMLHERQELDSVMNIIEKQTSRYIPVYRSRIDNLTGYIDLLSVFRSNKRKKNVRDFVEDAVYVPEMATVASLYRKFPLFHDKLLIVVNEYGGSSGIITSATLVHKALDLERRSTEVPQEQEVIKQTAPNTYVAAASLDIDKFNEIFKRRIVKKGFETLGGFLLYLYGEVPEEGVILYHEDLRFKIMRATVSGIESVRVVFLSKKRAAADIHTGQ